MAQKDVVELFARVPLFSECSKRELQAIAGATKEVSYEAGRVLAREGEQGVGFFLIDEGTARIVIDGRTRAKLGPGDFFGEVSLLDDGPRTATVVAETPMRVLGLTAWTFKRILRSHPSIAQKLLRVLAERLRRSSRDSSP